MAITALPTPPSRQRPDTFAAEGDTFLAALPVFATEANALAATVNNYAAQVATDREAAELTAQTANFKGEWSSLTGALTVPSSVLHSGSYWMLLSNLADVTTKEPGVDPEWELIYIDVSSAGGAVEWTVSTDTTITAARLHSISTTSDGLTITLPASTPASIGAPAYVIINAGTKAFYVRSNTGKALCTLLPFYSVEIYQIDDSPEKFVANQPQKSTPSNLSPTLAQLLFTESAQLSKISAAEFDDTYSLVAYGYGTGPYTFKCRLLTRSGDVITAGSAQDFASGVANYDLSVISINSTTALILYVLSSDGSKNAVLVTRTGSTLSFGTPSQITGLPLSGASVFNAVLLDTDKVLYGHVNGGTDLRIGVITTTGGVLAFGSPTSPITVNYESVTVTKLSSTAAFVVYQTSSGLSGVVATVSGTSTSVGSTDVVDSGITSGGTYGLMVHAESPTIVHVIVENDASTFRIWGYTKVTISGTTPTSPNITNTYVSDVYSAPVLGGSIQLDSSKSIALLPKAAYDETYLTGMYYGLVDFQLGPTEIKRVRGPGNFYYAYGNLRAYDESICKFSDAIMVVHVSGSETNTKMYAQLIKTS